MTDLVSRTAYRSQVNNDAVFTLVLKRSSHLVSGTERARILAALQGGRSRLEIDVISHCTCCNQAHRVTLDTADVTGFLAHEQESIETSRNVVPLRPAAYRAS